MFKKIYIEPIVNTIPIVTIISLQPINVLDYNIFTQNELWINFIKPYFTESNKICTIGDVLIMSSHEHKVKYIVGGMVNKNKCLLSGCINSETQICYNISEPIDSIVQFYKTNKFITMDLKNNKFKLFWDFVEPINTNENSNENSNENNQDNNNYITFSKNNTPIHNINSFVIISGLCIFYLWILQRDTFK